MNKIPVQIKVTYYIKEDCDFLYIHCSCNYFWRLLLSASVVWEEVSLICMENFTQPLASLFISRFVEYILYLSWARFLTIISELAYTRSPMYISKCWTCPTPTLGIILEYGISERWNRSQTGGACSISHRTLSIGSWDILQLDVSQILLIGYEFQISKPVSMMKLSNICSCRRSWSCKTLHCIDTIKI